MGGKDSQKTRDNHYVPQWYQKGFIQEGGQLHYLNLTPDPIKDSNGNIIKHHKPYRKLSPKQAFYQTDLYTTFFGQYINDDIEKYLFGKIDETGAAAVKAFIKGGIRNYHDHFSSFFEYLDSQKLRTPKGLDWIKTHYKELDQLDLMIEMQSLRNIHCTMWGEGVREIVSAEKSATKFIISDHPVTLFNNALPPQSESCQYPNEPDFGYNATQTIFPLNAENCLILTHYDYAKKPDSVATCSNRVNARNFGQSLVKTDAFIRERQLTEREVQQINYIIKSRAKRYIAAGKKEWLYPEQNVENCWEKAREVLLPPPSALFHFGGETYVGYEDGTVHYQDAYGRTRPTSDFLIKKPPKDKQRRNDRCSCGSGKKYKKCCLEKPEHLRPSNKARSIRERNLRFIKYVYDQLGLSEGKTWLDVRRELSDDQVKNIHVFYSMLWPQSTDILSFIPKADGCFRALYTGIIDPRTITSVATSITVHVDELLIVQPFINDNFINPEHSPVKHPSNYKQETLKNIYLLLELEPFIYDGSINFIPNFSTWNPRLGLDVLKMAENRIPGSYVNKKQLAVCERLSEDDFKRQTYLLPREYHVAQLKKYDPDASDKMVEEVLQVIESEKLKDDLLLLQDNLLGDKEGGQYCLLHLLPNYEFSLFIAQATGSFILTDSPHRMEEFVSNLGNDNCQVWSKIVEMIGANILTLNVNPEIAFLLRKSGKFNGLRTAFKCLNATIFKNVPKDNQIESLCNEFIRSLSNNEKNMTEIDSIIEFHEGKPSDYNLRFNMKCFAPQKGLYETNVQRLLVSWGSKYHTSKVPWVLYIERTSN